MILTANFNNETCSLTSTTTTNGDLPVCSLKWSSFRDSVNEATDITSTTLDLVIDVNGNQTVIDRQMVECDRVFTVNNEMDLADGAKLTSGMTAELATMKIISSGEFNYFVKYN